MPEPAGTEGALRPRAFSPGARVALVAPGGPLEPERLETSQRRCSHLGLEPVLFPSARGRSGFLSASDAERLADLQDAFDDPEIDAVWALRGGYGAIRIVDRLSLERQQRDPIPFIGFSDNTVFHVAHAKIGVVSFHGPHPGGEFPAATEAAFRRVLFAGDSPDPPVIEGSAAVAGTLAGGTAEGPLWGGNLATLASLCGSASPLSADGRILCLEDIGEPAYRIDRMWVQLERAGVFRGVRGIALGGFTGSPAGEEEAVRTVLRERIRELGVPVVADLPFGHMAWNVTLPIGVRARVNGRKGTLEILQRAVQSGSRLSAGR